MRVGDALALARGLGVARLDAQLLLAHRLAQPRAWLLAHDDAFVDADTAARFGADLARRAAGVPLAYLVGEREFYGLMLEVTPAVLVPRPETEMLVDWALELLAGAGREPQRPAVLDLGTGSGAIALAVKARCARADMTATDASVAALVVARRNAQRHQLSVEFLHGDWWAALTVQRSFDLVLSNPPYIGAEDRHLDALAHEPPGALTPGGDGLTALATIIEGAPRHLRPGGRLIVEHGHDQSAAVRTLMLAQGLESVATRNDIAGLARCTAAAVGA